MRECGYPGKFNIILSGVQWDFKNLTSYIGKLCIWELLISETVIHS
jgi:hypothetical protein